ncbi:GNAT family N-acetyltransferase [Tenuibacillus multivorans]|uniref:L-amino acid N-acyltransferase YncA n=1 Tax=Tenuibacillus multivorans TaxID=237069 RepID=A0A1H0AM29_9BACI|nr:GNAT family N-acetyltransferase [Tenuibacillus multivorans]GEL78182.1 putative N-acetyltransferase YuaI [Tenuibacillus multivorans]SDN33886.1 L-amino acid N-acyltransferase YncA [Tenuibacillus multivorans]
MNVREAVAADYKGIAKVHVDSWRTTYQGIVPDQYLNQLSYAQREEVWKNNLANGKVWVAEDSNGQIVGFANGGPERSGDYPDYQGEIYAIYILEEYHGNGLGKQLVKQVVNELKQQDMSTMLVLVLKDNPASQFYQALGAELIDTLEIEIASKKLYEDVYAWNQLPQL